MERCNGTTHFEMTDAYDSHSYACPGPEKCTTAATLLSKREGPFKPKEGTIVATITVDCTDKTLDEVVQALDYQWEECRLDLIMKAVKTKYAK